MTTPGRQSERERWLVAFLLKTQAEIVLAFGQFTKEQKRAKLTAVYNSVEDFKSILADTINKL